MTEMNLPPGYRSRALNYLRTSIDHHYPRQPLSPSRSFSSSTPDLLDATAQQANSKKECYIFPTYAKRHYTKGEHEKIALHVNVHGWIYTPAIPGTSRRNKYTMLLARSLAGLPALPEPRRSATDPLTDDQPAAQGSSTLGRTAGRWFRRDASDSESERDSVPHSPPSESGRFHFSRTDTDASVDSNSSAGTAFEQLSDLDLRICHDNLNLRMGPFLSRPSVGRLVRLRIRIGTHHDSVHDLYTLENGHFKARIALPLEAQHNKEDLVHLAVIEDPEVSADASIPVIGDRGITVISDMDDTIKHTGITEGVRAAFRNAFVRQHQHLEVEGVRQWYQNLKEAGCALSYVSNAPWQLWPSLSRFLEAAQLPAGSVTLKEYNGGMLQSIWEPAAEKKRANVQRILEEFPQRKFLLVGDSGEQDIELYSELAAGGFADQILGIFIRDVSSSGQASTTGLSGEDFFSTGALDDVIDVRQPDEALQPPKLPKRKPVSLVDLSDATPSTPKPSEHLRDLLSLHSSQPSPVQESSSSPAPEHRDGEANGIGRPPPKQKPAVPPKPASLKTGPTSTPTCNIEQPQARRPALERNPSSSSLLSELTERTRKAGSGVVSQISSTYHGERKANEQIKRDEAWQRRVERARMLLPPSIKLYIWKTGADAERYAADLVKRAKRHFEATAS